MVNLTQWLHGQDDFPKPPSLPVPLSSLKSVPSKSRTPVSTSTVPRIRFLSESPPSSSSSELWDWEVPGKSVSDHFSDDESDGTVNSDDDWDTTVAEDEDGEMDDDSEEESVWCGDVSDKRYGLTFSHSNLLLSSTTGEATKAGEEGEEEEREVMEMLREIEEEGDERWEIVKEGGGEWENV